MESPSFHIPGYTDLEAFWGGFPSFHDSEVVALRLNRSGESQLAIRLIGPRKSLLVTFALTEIDDLQLQGFSAQNVISELTLERSGLGFRLELWPCFGLAGWITMRHISIAFEE